MPKDITERDKRYWSINLRLIITCLSIWAFVSYGMSLILRPLFMGITFGGMDLGFWFAQQGSIFTYLILITFYAWRMNKLDDEFGLED